MYKEQKKGIKGPCSGGGKQSILLKNIHHRIQVINGNPG